MNNCFLPQKGDYRNLRVYQLGNCIYALTFAFTHKHLQTGDRTIDQMVQAARSGKQNIAEGSVDGTTSSEMEIKLTNVAKASMHELRIDYEDFLLVRGLAKWDCNDSRTQQVRNFCRTHMEPESYLKAVENRSAETIANIAITMLHQFDVMITRLIETQKQRFLNEGGIKEQMYRARVQHRGNGWQQDGAQSNQNDQDRQRPTE